jgi:DNA transposition AAA+ family ATPase
MTLLGERTLAYMKAQHLRRQEMAERAEIRLRDLGMYLDGLAVGTRGKDTVEVALGAFFLKLDRAQARAQRPPFLETATARLTLEKCQEAGDRRELALLYGPSGIGKTFAIEEFMARCEKKDDTEKPEALFVTAHSASTPKSLMAALCQQAGVPTKGPAATLAESLVKKLAAGHYLIVVDEASHLEIQAMELLRYVYDRGRVGVMLVGTLRLYEVFTDGSRPASELEQLWSRVGICELLPGLTEYEGRQMISRGLGRLPEPTIRQVLGQTGSSMRRLATLLEHLKELRELNAGRPIDDLIPIAVVGLMPAHR